MPIKIKNGKLVRSELGEDVADLAKVVAGVVQTKDTPLASRVSVFGESYKAAKDASWRWMEDVGWVHELERGTFESRYFKSKLSQKWFSREVRTVMIGMDGNNGYVSAQETKDHKLVLCSMSGYWTVKEDIDQCYTSPTKKINYSRTIAKSNGGIATCQIYDKPFLQGHTVRIRRSDKYSTVSKHAATHSGLFNQCGHCGHFYEKAMTLEVDGGFKCKWCNQIHKARHSILKFNAPMELPPIFEPHMRWGAVKKDGMWTSTGKQEAVKTTRLFGVELEVELDLTAAKRADVNRWDVAEDMTRMAGKDFCICKEDSSLNMNGDYKDGDEPGHSYAGFEMVSCPADMKNQVERWGRLSGSKHFKLLRSWNTETCGMHIHVSKASLSTLQVCRIARFLNLGKNKKFVAKCAGRSERKYCRYIEKELTDAAHPERMISPEEKEAHNRSRRVALNVANTHTVEFRIFRGTVNERHIKRNLEFVDSLCDFCYPAARSIQEIDDWKAFVAYVWQNRRRWPMLNEWFVKQEMVKWKKPSKKADISKMTLRPDLSSEDVDPKELEKAKIKLEALTEENNNF